MEMKNYLRLVCVTLIIIFAVLFTAAVPVSCRMTEDGIEIIAVENTIPKILSYSTLDSSTLSILCSQKVSVSEVMIKSADDVYVSENNRISYLQDGCLVKIEMEEAVAAGTEYVVTGLVKDEKGNALSFSLPFTGFNENPARLLFSEIRTKHSASNGVLKKSEYVELYVLRDGNTAGLEIISGSDGESKKYCFPLIDVKAGEYITVHFRTPAEGECIDELEDNLELSTAADSCNEARDLWIENIESRISDNDVILLRDACREKVMDAVLFSASDKTGWYYAGQKALSIEAFEAGVWPEGSGTDNAACSDYITLTRSLNRLNLSEIIKQWSDKEITPDTIIEAKKDDWAVTVKATPGAENCLELYTK